MSTAPWFRPYRDDPASCTKYATYMALPSAAAKRDRLPELKRELALDSLLRTRPASIPAATYNERARAFIGDMDAIPSYKTLIANWHKEKANMRAAAAEASFLAGALRVPKGVPAHMREQYMAAARASAEGSVGMPMADRRKALAAAIDDLYTTAITVRPMTVNKKSGALRQLAHDQVVPIPTRLLQELPLGNIARDSAPFTKLLEVLKKAKEFALVELLGINIHSLIDHVVVTVGGVVARPKGIPAQQRRVKAEGAPLVCSEYLPVNLTVVKGKLVFARADGVVEGPSTNDCFAQAMVAQLPSKWKPSVAMVEEWLGRPMDRELGESAETMQHAHALASVGMKVVNPAGALLHSWQPHSLTKDGANMMHYMLAGGHVTALGSTARRSLAQAPVELMQAPRNTLRAKRVDPKQYRIANSAPEMVNRIEEALAEDAKGTVDILVNGEWDIMDAFISILDSGYQAGPMTHKHRFCGFEMRLQRRIMVRSLIEGAESEGRHIDADAQAKLTHWMCTLLNTMRDPAYLSSYSPSAQAIFNHTTIANMVFRFSEDAPKKAMTLDVARAYTATVRDIERVPVFSINDEVRPYKGEAIEDYSFYTVQRTDMEQTPSLMMEHANGLLSGRGLKLALELGDKFRIVGVLRPSQLLPNHARPVIEEMYRDVDADKFVKLVCNIAFGMVTKRTAHNEECKYTTDIEDTQGFSQVIPFARGWLASRCSETVQLINGFYATWSLLIYEGHRMRMALELRRLQEARIPVYGIAVDAFLVGAVVPGADPKPKTLATIGTFMMETGEKCVPERILSVQNKDLELPPMPEEPPELQKTEVVQDRTFVEGRVPGSGKTYTCFHGSKGMNILWVAPSNKQKNRLGGEYGGAECTYHSLLGIGVTDGQVVKAIDVSEFDRVIFDEMLQLDDRMFLKACQWVREHPDVEVVANGDALQLCNGNTFNNVKRTVTVDRMLRKTFTSRLTLLVNRRLLTDEDRVAMDKWFQDTHVHGKDMIEAARELGVNFISSMQEAKALGIRKVIALENNTAHEANRILVGQAGVGDYVIAKKRHKRLVMNECYQVQNVTQGLYHINGHYFSPDHFRPDAAMTCHGVQGDAIREKYLICDVHHKRMTWEWMWVALTRTTRISDIYIYNGPALLNTFHKHVHSKLSGHRASDAAKGYDNDLTYDWVTSTLKAQNYCCGYCGGFMTLESDDPHDDDLFSVDRINNALGHVQGNCRMTHLGCNKARQ